MVGRSQILKSFVNNNQTKRSKIDAQRERFFFFTSYDNVNKEEKKYFFAINLILLRLNDMNRLRQKRFSEFFKQERERFVNYVKRWIDGTSDMEAEDIVQDVMLNIFDSADITRPIENLSAYIYLSLKNGVVDQFRKKKTIPLDDEMGLSLKELITDVNDDSHSKLEKLQDLENLYEAIDDLDPKDRAIIVATELEGISYKQLSLEWNEPLGTLLARKSRALKKIRKLLTFQIKSLGE